MGLAGCKSLPVCREAGCSADGGDKIGKEGCLLEDDWNYTSSPEALFELELKQRKQWAKSMRATPSVAVASGSTAPAPVDFDAMFQKDLKGVMERAKEAEGTAKNVETDKAASSSAPSAEPKVVSKEIVDAEDTLPPVGTSNGTVINAEDDKPEDNKPEWNIDQKASKQSSASAKTAKSVESAQPSATGQPDSKAAQEATANQAIAFGDTVSVDGREGIVNWDQRPKGQHVSVIWKDDNTESDVIPLSSVVLVEKAKQADAGAEKKKEVRKTPAQKPRRKEPQVEASCPSSKKDEDFERELKALKKKQKEKEKGIKPKEKEKGISDAGMYNIYSSFCSAGERDMRKGMFISFYREQYAKIGSLDVSQYQEDASFGLSIKGGHRPMPRPKDQPDLPEDYKKPLGSITEDELRKYGCESKRMLLCVHGDLFDVSDRPDKYGKDGPYWAMVGHDITWGLVCGNDDMSTYDMYFDIFKIQPIEAADRRLQGVISWWCFYEKEYGAPVGRLKVYDEEWKLPEPPEVGDVCSIM